MRAANDRRRWGFNYEMVSPRFATREAFVAHLRSLPSVRPNDFFLGVTVDGQELMVREGETRSEAAWLIHVAEVASPEWAWSRSTFGIARAHRALSADAFRTSVNRVAQHLHIERR